MKPIWKDKKLTVQFHEPDRNILIKARDLGEALVAMHQDDGQLLIDAIDKLIPPEIPA